MIYSMVSSCPLVLLVSDRLQALWAPHDFAFWRDSFSSSNGSMQHSPRGLCVDLLLVPIGMFAAEHLPDGVASRQPHASGDGQALLRGHPAQELNHLGIGCFEVSNGR